MEIDENEVQIRAKNFLENHSILTFATCFEGKAYLHNGFYVLDNKGNLVFILKKSDTVVDNIKENPKVTALIYRHNNEPKDYKGIKLEGEISKLEKKEVKDILDKYETTFPKLIKQHQTHLDFTKSDAISNFYKLIPEKIYFRDTEVFKGEKEISQLNNS